MMVALPKTIPSFSTHIVVIRVKHPRGGHIGECSDLCGGLPVLSRELRPDTIGLVRGEQAAWVTEEPFHAVTEDETAALRALLVGRREG